MKRKLTEKEVVKVQGFRSLR